LAKAGITLNCQIVCCPGINSGQELTKTITGLMKMGPCINSVSIVPVGLTKYRQDLMKLKPFDKYLALKTVRQVEYYGEKCLKLRGSRVFYCADELYMLAGLKLPGNKFYEDYPQLENGVGMMRLFITEFKGALVNMDSSVEYSVSNQQNGCSIVTGVLAKKYLINLSDTINKKYGKIISGVYAVKNRFFGESITVSGLITGRDIIGQLKGKNPGSKLLIPQNMLRNMGVSKSVAGDEVFLDDLTVSDVSNALGVPVRIVKQDGADLLQAILGK